MLRSLGVRARLLIAFSMILILFGVSMAVFHWGSIQKDLSFLQLSSCQNRKIQILSIDKAVSQLKKEIILIHQVSATANKNEIAPMGHEEINALEKQLTSIESKIQILRGTLQESEINDFIKKYSELTSAWLKFYHDYGTSKHEDAMSFLALQNDNLSENLFKALSKLEANEEIAIIHAQEHFDQTTALVHRLTSYIFFVSVMAAFIVSFLLSKGILKNLSLLQKGADFLKNGQLSARVKTVSKDEFGALAVAFNEMANSIQSAKLISEELHTEIVAKQNELREVFNLVPLGIISFNETFTIHGLYSSAMEKIFPSLDPKGKDFFTLLSSFSSLSRQEMAILRSDLLIVFGQDDLQWDLTSLENYREFQSSWNGIQKKLRVRFCRIKNEAELCDRIFCQFEDVTEINELKDAMEVVSNRMRRLDVIVENGSKVFSRTLNEARIGWTYLMQYLDRRGQFVDKELSRFKRVLHTSKGVSRLYKMTDLSDLFHEVEDHLEKNDSLEHLNNCAARMSHVFGEYSLLLAKLADQVEDSSMVGLEQLHSKSQQLFEHVTRMIPESKKTFSFKGTNHILVNTKLSIKLTEIVSHCLSNSLSHGFGLDSEESASSDRDVGIAFEFQKNDEDLEIKIKDNGRGIQLQKLKDKAIQRGIYSPEEAMALSDEAVQLLIFHGGLSTANEVSMQSGRGEGMNAVMEAVQELNGKISVISVENQGTEMLIHIPIQGNGRIPNCIFLKDSDSDIEIPSSVA